MSESKTAGPYDLTTMIFLMWEDESASRHGRRRPLAERLAPACERFLARFGRPPALVLLPEPEPSAGVALPVQVYRGVGRHHLWLGAPATPSQPVPPSLPTARIPGPRSRPVPGLAGRARAPTAVPVDGPAAPPAPPSMPAQQVPLWSDTPVT